MTIEVLLTRRLTQYCAGHRPLPSGTVAIRAPSCVSGLERCHHIALRPLPSRYRLRRYARRTDICWITRLDAVAARIQFEDRP